jgi:hypothetical protein
VYLIRQPSRRRGLFSLVASVLCHIDFAKKNGFTPFVDFEDSPTIYDDGLQNGSLNSWEYYFEQPNNLREKPDPHQVARVSSASFPPGYDYTLCNNPGLFDRVIKDLKIKKNIQKDADNFLEKMGKNVLGLQFRGQEMRYFRGHHLPPTKKQISRLIQDLTEAYGFDSVFVTTEDSGLLNHVVNSSPVPVFFTSAYRLEGKNSYSIYPRENHRYLLGKEVLVDALILSRCDGLIHCSSNVANFSRFLCEDQYLARAELLNWLNTRIFPLNYLYWPLFRFWTEALSTNPTQQYLKIYESNTRGELE